MNFMLAYLSFILGFVFFVLHESNLFRRSFAWIGKWFEPTNPIKMKKKFPFLPMVWNFYHFSGWMALFMFFNAMFFSGNYDFPVCYGVIGISIAFITYLIDFGLYGVGGKN